MWCGPDSSQPGPRPPISTTRPPSSVERPIFTLSSHLPNFSTCCVNDASWSDQTCYVPSPPITRRAPKRTHYDHRPRAVSLGGLMIHGEPVAIGLVILFLASSGSMVPKCPTRRSPHRQSPRGLRPRCLRSVRSPQFMAWPLLALGGAALYFCMRRRCPSRAVRYSCLRHISTRLRQFWSVEASARRLAGVPRAPPGVGFCSVPCCSHGRYAFIHWRPICFCGPVWTKQREHC